MSARIIGNPAAPVHFRAKVVGTPRPQGSKTSYPFVRTFADGRPMYRKDRRGNLVPILGVRLTEGGTPAQRAAFEQWRGTVAATARSLHAGYPVAGPLLATYHFFLPMPKTTKYPEAPAGPPDLDKLMRAVNDALTGIVFHDDGQIVRDGGSGKFWCPPGRAPGVDIEIRGIR